MMMLMMGKIVIVTAAADANDTDDHSDFPSE
jgi:hypothetical protein